MSNQKPTTVNASLLFHNDEPKPKPEPVRRGELPPNFIRRFPRAIKNSERPLLGIIADPGDHARPALPGGKIPLPEPPALPAPYEPPVEAPERKPLPGPVDWRSIPKGPYDPRQPLPWDDHVYPEIVEPPELPLSARIDLFLTAQSRRFLDARGRPKWQDDDDQERPALPPREERPLLPADADGSSSNEVVRADLPAGRYGVIPQPDWMTPADWAELTSSAGSYIEQATLDDPARARDVAEAAFKSLRGNAGIQFRDRLGDMLAGTALKMLDDYLRANGIRYFSAKELTLHKWRHIPRGKQAEISMWSFMLDYYDPQAFPDGVFSVMPRYIVPPPQMWPNIIPVLRVIDRIRHLKGAPIRGISGYRHPSYNAMIEGVKDSPHMSFVALDITYAARVGDQIDVNWFREPYNYLFRQRGDGLGRYAPPKGKFLHVDVGLQRHLDPNRGVNWWKPDSAREYLP